MGIKQDVRNLDEEDGDKKRTKRGRAEFEESLVVNNTPMPVSFIKLRPFTHDLKQKGSQKS